MVENPQFSELSLNYYKKSYYLRDAQGNIMAVYNRTYAGESFEDLTMSFSLVERSVYGSSRIANFVDSVQLVYLEAEETEFSYPDNINITSQTNGFKHFELTNHLGNVMAVVSDKRTPIITASEISGYTPELLIAKDYYPFGMEMSGRYSLSDPENLDNEYRFGFQGQEKNDDWTGQTGSHLDFKYRVYDARIGRFFAIDPLAAKYPYYSTYAFSGNRVIDAIELEGLEPVIPNTKMYAYNEHFPKMFAESAKRLENKTLKFEVHGSTSIGLQAGGEFETPIGDVSLNGNILSTEIFGVTFSQKEKDSNPLEYEFDGLLYDGELDLEQGFSAEAFVGISYSHTMEVAKSQSKTVENETHTYTVSYGSIKGEAEYNSETKETTQTESVEIGYKGSLILGVEITVSLSLVEDE